MRTIALVVILTAVTGCESVESQDVLSDSIYANLDARSDGTQTLTMGVLREGGATSNTYVNLTGDDYLSVTVGGETEILQEQNIGDVYAYAAWFDTTAGGSEFEFSLTRTMDDGAESSVATLPDSFDLSGPTDGTTFSRESDDIVVTWVGSGSGDATTVDLGGDCIDSYSAEIVEDNGTWTIPAGQVLPFSTDTSKETCQMDLTISRSRVGTLDPGYGAGGMVRGIQDRKVSIFSGP